LIVVQIEIPEYDPTLGLRLPVVFGSAIEASGRGSEFVIRANESGLRLMAGQLIALAQHGVPAGTHLHFDPGAPLEDGSDAFVVERVESDL
jgi:hypothetical protein